MSPDTRDGSSGTRLARERYLEVMDAELDALVDAASELGRDVPSCPGWTMRDLVSHVIGVYRHKVVALETDTQPPQRDGGWGQLGPDDDAVAVLRSTYDDLRALLVARPDSATTWTWWPGEQTVGFWVRRMAHETAVHRWDAQGAARGVAEADPIDDDVAVDGADEMLGWLTWEWPEELAQHGADGQRVLVSSLDHDWVVTLHPTVAEVERGGTDDAVAMLAAAPSDLILHLWGRPVDRVATTGDLDALRLLRERLSASTG